jgi:hypothetical protein
MSLNSNRQGGGGIQTAYYQLSDDWWYRTQKLISTAEEKWAAGTKVCYEIHYKRKGTATKLSAISITSYILRNVLPAYSLCTYIYSESKIRIYFWTYSRSGFFGHWDYERTLIPCIWFKTKWHVNIILLGLSYNSDLIRRIRLKHKQKKKTMTAGSNDACKTVHGTHNKHSPVLSQF